MNKLLKGFLNYKLYVENLTTEKETTKFLKSICEIAELEFLSILPRNIKPNQLESYIEKINLKFGTHYDSKYLKMRWQKIFKDHLYKSKSEAGPIIVKRDKYICQYCSRVNKLEIHHVIPIDAKKYRGVNSYYNMVLACKKCNLEISNSIRLPKNWWELHPDSKHRPMGQDTK